MKSTSLFDICDLISFDFIHEFIADSINILVANRIFPLDQEFFKSCLHSFSEQKLVKDLERQHMQ